MKKHTILALSILGVTALSLNAQQSSGSAVQNNQPNQGNLPPGLQNRQQLPPGLNQRDNLPPGLQRQELFKGGTATNAAASGATTNVLMQDQAFTQIDRTLLIRLRQTILPLLGTSTVTTASGQPWAPVHFIVRDQVVTIIGFVATIEQKQQVVTTAQRTPGVLRVFDQLQLRPMDNQAQTGLAPTSDQTRTNRIFASTNLTNLPTQDQALTQIDRSLLVKLQQAILPIVGAIESATTTGGPSMPVHFIVRQQVVTLTGFVITAEQRQQVVTTVQRTPGVVRVIDQLEIRPRQETGATLGTTQPTATPQIDTTTAAAAAGVNATNQFGLNQTNQFGANTNQLTPTGTNTGRVYQQGLPPGLQKRDELPPGLEKRDELPPGLSQRTNSPPQ